MQQAFQKEKWSHKLREKEKTFSHTHKNITWKMPSGKKKQTVADIDT